MQRKEGDSIVVKHPASSYMVCYYDCDFYGGPRFHSSFNFLIILVAISLFAFDSNIIIIINIYIYINIHVPVNII